MSLLSLNVFLLPLIINIFKNKSILNKILVKISGMLFIRSHPNCNAEVRHFVHCFHSTTCWAALLCRLRKKSHILLTLADIYPNLLNHYNLKHVVEFVWGSYTKNQESDVVKLNSGKSPHKCILLLTTDGEQIF